MSDFDDCLTDLNAAVTDGCGTDGTYIVASTGEEISVDVVIDDKTGVVGDSEIGPVEAIPVAHIDETQVAACVPGDRLEVGSDRYQVDAPVSKDNGIWTLPLLVME